MQLIEPALFWIPPAVLPDFAKWLIYIAPVDRRSCGDDAALGGRAGNRVSLARNLESFFEVVPQQPSASLLHRHGLGDLASEELEPALGVEPKRSALDVSSADHHAREAECAGRVLGRTQHTLRHATAAPSGIDVHAPKLRRLAAVAFDAKRAHDQLAAVDGLDHPEGIAPRLGEDFEQARKLALDGGRDVSLEEGFHPGWRELPVDARPHISHRLEIGGRVGPEPDLLLIRHT